MTFFSPALILFLFTYHPPDTDEQRSMHSLISSGSLQLREQLTAIENALHAGTLPYTQAFDEVYAVVTHYTSSINSCVPAGISERELFGISKEVANVIDALCDVRMIANRGVQAHRTDPSWRRYFAIARTEVERAEMRMNRVIAVLFAARKESEDVQDQFARFNEEDEANTQVTDPTPTQLSLLDGGLSGDDAQAEAEPDLALTTEEPPAEAVAIDVETQVETELEPSTEPSTAEVIERVQQEAEARREAVEASEAEHTNHTEHALRSAATPKGPGRVKHPSGNPLKR